MKLAIVHDFLNQFGGAERVVGCFTRIFPEAPIYTSIYFKNSTFGLFSQKDIRTSFMQKIPGINRHYRKFFFLYPFAFRRFDLDEYDIILTSSSSFANYVRKGNSSKIISYCYTPARFLWNSDKYLKRERIPKIVKILIKPLINNLRKKDVEASKKIDHFITISNYIKERVKRVYDRDSNVIYPPIEIERYRYQEEKEDFYLIVSRLKGYKRVDIAINAFNDLKRKLVIVGTGEEEVYLKKIAGPNIEFKGRVSEEKLLDYYSHAKALVFTGVEDFGLTPVEAQASGTPAIAFRGGGALETILEGKTGIFYDRPEPESLGKAVMEFEKIKIDPRDCRENALRFDFGDFKKIFIQFLEKAYGK
jgi:glycosyltransferase involved in cell wall biosynthesis